MEDPEEGTHVLRESRSEANLARTDHIKIDRMSEAVPLKLVVVSGRDFGKTLALQRGSYRVGKSRRSDLVLTDSSVSREHLLVETLPGGCRFRDQGSTNGSFFGNSRFALLEAPPGSVIRIGHTELQLLPVSERIPIVPSTKSELGALVGTSLLMRQTFALLERAAAGDADVLLQGETGTGKELAAEALHELGPRAGRPFVVCDLSSTPHSLVESELFGHVRGAYTGAVSDRPGAFERAHGGTLFLDEIGEVALEIQPRLLRALERRQVKRVGGNSYASVDVRVVAATHRKLEDEVAAGRFREDLYHRLAVVTAVLPPLRERLEDLPLLVNALLTRSGRAPAAGSILSPETQILLRTHHWPGNVRELRNVIERAVRLGVDPEIPASQQARPTRSSGADARTPFKEAKENLVSAFERDYLADLLRRFEGNISVAARESGIGRAYLHRLLKKHGLARD
jgi:DNA-binding NtrC family response regulator